MKKFSQQCLLEKAQLMGKQKDKVSKSSKRKRSYKGEESDALCEKRKKIASSVSAPEVKKDTPPPEIKKKSVGRPAKQETLQSDLSNSATSVEIEQKSSSCQKKKKKKWQRPFGKRKRRIKNNSKKSNPSPEDSLVDSTGNCSQQSRQMAREASINELQVIAFGCAEMSDVVPTKVEDVEPADVACSFQVDEAIQPTLCDPAQLIELPQPELFNSDDSACSKSEPVMPSLVRFDAPSSVTSKSEDFNDPTILNLPSPSHACENDIDSRLSVELFPDSPSDSSTHSSYFTTCSSPIQPLDVFNSSPIDIPTPEKNNSVSTWTLNNTEETENYDWFLNENRSKISNPLASWLRKSSPDNIKCTTPDSFSRALTEIPVAHVGELVYYENDEMLTTYFWCHFLI